MSFSRIVSIFIFFIPELLPAQQPRLVLPIGHTDYIEVAQFSPDGKLLLTASHDKTAKIWDAKTGVLLADLAGHNDYVDIASFSPDNKKIITVSDGLAKLWDAGTGELLIDSLGGFYAVKYAMFFPDSRKIIFQDYDTTRICDAVTGQQLSSLFTGYYSAAALSPDGIVFATINLKSNIKIWNTSTGKLVKEINAGSKMWRLSFVPHQANLLLLNDLSSVQIWDIQSGKPAVGPINNILHNIKEMRDIIYSPEGNALLIATDKNINVVDTRSGSLLNTIIANKFSTLEKARFFPDGKRFVIAETGIVELEDVGTCKLSVWNIGDKKPVIITIVHDFYTIVNQLETSPDNKSVFLGSNSPKESFIVDAMRRNSIVQLNTHGDVYYSAAFNHNGDKIIMASTGKPCIWDINSAAPDSLVNSTMSSFAEFSPDDKKTLLLEGGGTNISLLSNSAPFIRKKLIPKDKRTFNGVRFSPDSRKLLFWDTNNQAFIWDATTYEIISESEQLEKGIIFGGFSREGDRVITANSDSVIIWSADTWDIKRIYKQSFKKRDFIKTVEFSHDDKKILNSYFSGYIRIWDSETGALLDSAKVGDNYIREAHFNNTGTKILFVTYDYDVGLYDLLTHQTTYLKKSHQREIRSAKFSPDGKSILTASRDFTCKIWNTGSGSLLYTFFTLDSTDYFIQLPSGYYKATPTAAKLLHYVTKNLQVISFEQLDVRFNRPDKVLEAVGSTDTSLIKSYKRAWEKRIKKLGIDTTTFRDGYSVPKADFQNRGTIEYEQKEDVLALHIKGTDSTYKLDRFNLWINESPVYGQRGVSLKRKNVNDIDTVVSIRLSQGENRIETTITNVNGVESYRMPLIVNYTPAYKEKESTHFIGIGIDRFSDQQYNLQYSSKDIRDLSEKLKNKYGNEITIDTLFNEKVTVENVKALKLKLLQTTVNDKVIIAYSGHGLLSKDYDYYLSTYSVNFNKPEQNGLPYDELENLLDSIPARKKLMLIDACHSGEVDKEEGIAMNKTADSLGISKGGIIVTSGNPQVGLKNSFELMQSLFVNVGKSTGATVISAAAGNQFALERGDLKNGVFTYCLLEAMDKYPSMKISKLKRIVGEQVVKLTNGMQKPTSRNETIAVDWNIW